MPSINLPLSRHAAPAAAFGWQWLPYTDATLLHILRDAILVIDRKITGFKPCDDAFTALPSGRTFAQVWADPSIWISYDPDRSGRKYGVTDRVNGREISITQYALRMGMWTTAATLVHELAHTNGAPGGRSHAAEGTLRTCLMKSLEDPAILGAIERASEFEGTADV
jgi:hypothetical protein